MQVTETIIQSLFWIETIGIFHWMDAIHCDKLGRTIIGQKFIHFFFFICSYLLFKLRYVVQIKMWLII